MRFNKEPAVILGAIASGVMLLLQWHEGSIGVTDLIEGLIPLAASLLIRQKVWSPEGHEQDLRRAEADRRRAARLRGRRDRP